MSRQVSALIAAESGELRAGLQALLESIPGIGLIAQAYDQQTLEQLLAGDTSMLCLIDARLAEAVVGRDQRMVVVLADHQREQLPALTGGAAQVVVKGTPAAQLVALIDQLLAGAEPDVGAPVGAA